MAVTLRNSPMTSALISDLKDRLRLQSFNLFATRERPSKCRDALHLLSLLR